MTGFYVDIIFLGILLTIAALSMIVAEKRKAFKFLTSFEEKKNELTEIVLDAEQMIEEMNRLSEQIVANLDTKFDEITEKLSLIQKQSMKEDEDESQMLPDTTPAQIDGTAPVISRHTEVLKLLEQGMREAEIAKRMNMGKGEVQLIAGMKK